MVRPNAAAAAPVGGQRIDPGVVGKEALFACEARTDEMPIEEHADRSLRREARQRRQRSLAVLSCWRAVCKTYNALAGFGRRAMAA
jgi:hypothetical protein